MFNLNLILIIVVILIFGSIYLWERVKYSAAILIGKQYKVLLLRLAQEKLTLTSYYFLGQKNGFLSDTLVANIKGDMVLVVYPRGNTCLLIGERFRSVGLLTGERFRPV